MDVPHLGVEVGEGSDHGVVHHLHPERVREVVVDAEQDGLPADGRGDPNFCLDDQTRLDEGPCDARDGCGAQVQLRRQVGTGDPTVPVDRIDHGSLVKRPDPLAPQGAAECARHPHVLLIHLVQ